MNRKSVSSARGGFSLIEVLVAAGITALLAVLVVSVAKPIQDRARSTDCLNNLRQIALILQSYAADRDGWMPSASGNNVNAQNTSASWMIAVTEFAAINFPKLNQDTLLLCPAARETYPGGNARRTYAMNVAGTTGNVAWKPISFRNPSKAALILDSKSNGGATGDGWATIGLSDFQTNVDYRHHGGVNILFVDGHVEHLPKNNLSSLQTVVANFHPNNR